MHFIYFRLIAILFTLLFVHSGMALDGSYSVLDPTLVDKKIENLSLKQAVATAKQNDLWLVGNHYSQLAAESESIAAGTLPDPKLSLSYANLPTNTFDTDQEGMTQFKVGVSQMFPRGDSRHLEQEKLAVLSQQFPYQRDDRVAKLEVMVTRFWLDIYKAQESIHLIEENRALFEQLVDIAEASYSSALGRTRQQDVVRAQLELTRIEDRLTVLHQQLSVSKKQLLELVGSSFVDNDIEQKQPLSYLSEFTVDSSIPNIEVNDLEMVLSHSIIPDQELASYFIFHPAVKAIDQQIKATETDVSLAKQKYKPEWGVNASYGYREDDPMGMERSDLFSVGVTFDLPIFTSNRQDKQRDAAISRSEAKKTEKWLLLRKMISEFESNKSQLIRLDERKNLYEMQLLPQMSEQAEASLTAYTHDDGDFSEVVRSRISELNAKIDALLISVDRQKTISQLNYFLLKEGDKSQEKKQ